MLLHASPKLPAHTPAIVDEQFQLVHGGFVGAPFAFQIEFHREAAAPPCRPPDPSMRHFGFDFVVRPATRMNVTQNASLANVVGSR